MGDIRPFPILLYFCQGYDQSFQLICIYHIHILTFLLSLFIYHDLLIKIYPVKNIQFMIFKFYSKDKSSFRRYNLLKYYQNGICIMHIKTNICLLVKLTKQTNNSQNFNDKTKKYRKGTASNKLEIQPTRSSMVSYGSCEIFPGFGLAIRCMLLRILL